MWSIYNRSELHITVFILELQNYLMLKGPKACSVFNETDKEKKSIPEDHYLLPHETVLKICVCWPFGII